MNSPMIRRRMNKKRGRLRMGKVTVITGATSGIGKATALLLAGRGYECLGTVEEATDAEIQRQFDVNVFGVGRMCRAALPLMRARRSGVIVNISAWLGRMGFPLLTYYNASKYAVEAITDSLRYEVKPFVIRVHSVMPGLFRTRFVSGGLVANPATVSPESPYAPLAGDTNPARAKKMKEG